MNSSVSLEVAISKIFGFFLCYAYAQQMCVHKCRKMSKRQKYTIYDLFINLITQIPYINGYYFILIN